MTNIAVIAIYNKNDIYIIGAYIIISHSIVFCIDFID